MEQKNKYDVFISYSRKDIVEVNTFLEMLKQCIPTLNIWFYETSLKSCDDFEKQIISAIDNSSYVLFALSDNSMQSQWSRKEVMYAKHIGKKVIPILLKGAKPNGWFLFVFGNIDCYSSCQYDKVVEKLKKCVDIKISENKNKVESLTVKQLNKMSPKIKQQLIEDVVLKSDNISQNCQIFISYKRDNKDLVFPIKNKIELNTGKKCWIDLDGIESDAQFANVIIKAINNAKVFLFMYSSLHTHI